MKQSSDQIRNVIEDLNKIQFGSYPQSYVDSVVEDAVKALEQYSMFISCVERMDSNQIMIFKQLFNSIYGKKIV